MPRKCVLVLLDGLGDRAHASLGLRTPLEAARKPVLDRIARLGANGLYHASFLGQPLPSENAHFAMFGYGPETFPGRGLFEALGAGLPLAPGDVAILAHFVSVQEQDGTLVLADSHPPCSDGEAESLFSAVGEHTAQGLGFRLARTKGLDGILVLSGGAVPWVTDTDPILEGRLLSAVVPWAERAGDAAAQKTARALTSYLSWVHRSLRGHPVNARRMVARLPEIEGLVTQRAGQDRRAVPFAERWGLRALSISSGILYGGIARYLGFDWFRVEDGEDPGEDLAQRLTLARQALADYDFVHVHTKAPDEAAHRRNPQEKVAVIEALDRGIGWALGPLADDPDVLLVVTADHSTPSSGNLIHSGEPVPLTFLGEGVRRDAVDRFDEVSVAGGCLGCVRGPELMHLVLNALDRAKMAGLRETPDDRPCWPAPCEPFRLEEPERRAGRGGRGAP